jgi:hypothetical protein
MLKYNQPMKQRFILVTVSAVALSAAYGNLAMAQLILDCPQRLQVGSHNACSNGTLVINPDGSTQLTGCLATFNTPEPGQCVLSTGGVPPTRNVVVSFTTNSIFINGGGPQAGIDNFRMQPVGVATPQAQFTFTPLEVANTVTLDIGGRLNFSNNQAIGNYTGQVQITADLQ